MKRKFYVWMVWIGLYCFVLPVGAQNKYIITSYDDIQIKSGDKYLSVEDCEELTESDSIKFRKHGSIVLVNLESGKEYSRHLANITLPVRMLVVEAKQETQILAKISSYVKSFVPYEEKQSKSMQAIKSEMDNDSIQAIPVEIYRFLNSGQKMNNNDISPFVSCWLDFGEKLCTVANTSDSELYIDVLHVDDELFMSIFSPMLDWVSNMSVPPHSERTFWFVGDFHPSDQYLLVGSKKGLPLNGIFKLYRPGVEYKDREMDIELVLRKL